MNGDDEWKKLCARSADAMEHVLSQGTNPEYREKFDAFVARVRAIKTEAEYLRFNAYCREKNFEMLRALTSFEFN